MLVILSTPSIARALGWSPAGYTDVVEIGAGATSRVFKARHKKSGEIVALKRMHPQLAEQPETLARLRRELAALTALEHPQIVRVHEVVYLSGELVIVMDFIDGIDLAEMLRGGPLPIADVENIARALLDALAQAHGMGIVHRDLKPANVRVRQDGKVFLLDFGSASLEAGSSLTSTGTTLGTPEFMAPELFAGSSYDPRVDLFALGATLYACLTGEPPQRADSLTALAFRRANDAIAPILARRPDTSPGLAALVDRCLARAATDRFPSAAAALFALDHPEANRAVTLLRSALPPCLACERAIPPNSAVCPSCGSDHPFRFARGHTHVWLSGAKDPAQLFGLLVGLFPERATPAHAQELGERIALSRAEPQPLVSFIAREEAEALAEKLGSVGAEIEIVDDEGVRGLGLFALGVSALVVLGTLFAEIAGASIGLYGLLLAVPPLAALLYDRLSQVVRAEEGLLSGSWLPVPASERIRAIASGSAVTLVGAGLAAPLFGILDHQGALLLGGALFGISAILGGNLTRASSRKVGSAEPGLGAKLISAFTVPKEIVLRLRLPIAALAATSIVSVVPLELGALAALEAGMPTWASLTAEATLAVLPTSVELSELPAWAPRDSAIDADDLTVITGFAPELPPFFPPAPVSRTADVLLAALAGAALLFMLAARIQRARITRAGREIAGELAPQLLALGSRQAPHDRSDRRAALGPIDRLALEGDLGPFERAALAKVAAMSSLLSADEILALLAALKQKDRRLAALSLAARAGVEIDREQKLRLEILELEGSLEARAAERWAQSMKGDDE